MNNIASIQTLSEYFVYRSSNLVAITTDVIEAIRLQQKFPNSLVGFDLVGMEDQGHPLKYLLDALLYPSQHGIKLPYFFHAGETGQISINDIKMYTV